MIAAVFIVVMVGAAVLANIFSRRNKMETDIAGVRDALLIISIIYFAISSALIVTIKNL